ncbi:MAG: hypothetical protein F6K10_30630 [Moorea sp. SIO2B7]|nr:hypothetical protein [Moorena sp. SIO2B7]
MIDSRFFLLQEFSLSSPISLKRLRQKITISQKCLSPVNIENWLSIALEVQNLGLKVLHCLFQAFEYQTFQKARQWKPLPLPETSSCNIGILGLGVLGSDAAHKLNALGFLIRGWSRTPKNLG